MWKCLIGLVVVATGTSSRADCGALTLPSNSSSLQFSRKRYMSCCTAVFFPRHVSLFSQVLVSFKAEVSILAQLRHPNVVLYIGACTRPPNVFIVTEWCERGGLNDLLYDPVRAISAVTRIDFALQTAKGMCYLHK